MLEQKISDEEKFNRFLTEVNKRIGVDYEGSLELAKLLDYDPGNLSRILHGKRPLPETLIYRFCEYFKYKPGYFFGRDPFLISYDRKDLSPAGAKETLLKLLQSQQEMSNTIREALKGID